jgi:hypothetical protein
MRAKAIWRRRRGAHQLPDAPAFTSATQKIERLRPEVPAEDATRRPGAACVVLLVRPTMPDAYARVIGTP